jgi:hypothetical protein
MPDWEAELAALLQQLDVTLERGTLAEAAVDGLQSPATEFSSDAADSGSAFETSARSDAPSARDDEVSAIRNEIEATVARVAHLARTGQLDRAVRDDVVFVLQALTRPQPIAAGADDQDEWQLASAAAVLHFCRLVLRLTPGMED